MAKHRLPHDLKDDEFVDFLVYAKHFYDTNKKVINIALTSVVIVVFAFFFIKNQSAKRKAQSVEALGQVEMAYYQNQFEQVIQFGEDMLRKYKDTDEGGNCVVIVGNAYYALEEYDKAVSYYEKYINEYNNNEVYTVAAYEGIGNCYSQQGEFAKAAERYLKGVENHPEFYAAPFLMNKAADMYRQSGQSEKANDLYKKIIDEYPEYPQLAIVKSFYQE